MTSITFTGICSHFQGVVPGVPHRVVLPNATSVHFGLVRMQKDGGVGSYYLLPHFPVLLFTGKDSVELPTVPGLIEDGMIVTAVRLQIANAVQAELHVDGSYNSVPPIADYVPDYEFSNEVVVGGRAAAYFDVFGGHVSAAAGAGGTVHGGGPAVIAKDRAVNVVVKIDTYGPAVLQVTPFGAAGSIEKSTYLTIPEGFNLGVVNADIDPGNEDTPYDFLLHYLTARRGIPQLLSQPLPGLPLTRTGDLPRASHASVATALEGLAAIIANGGRPSKEQLRAMANAAQVLNASCSDTRYP